MSSVRLVFPLTALNNRVINSVSLERHVILLPTPGVHKSGRNWAFSQKIHFCLGPVGSPPWTALLVEREALWSVHLSGPPGRTLPVRHAGRGEAISLG